MAGIALVGFILCVAVLVAVVWLIARRRPQRAEPLASPVKSLLDTARRRAVIAVVFSTVVIVALFVAGYFLNSLVGLPVFLAPALGGAAGLLLYSAIPPRVIAVEPDTAREASLTPRTPLSFVPSLGASLLAATVVIQIAFLVFVGVTSSPDESGRYRVIAFHTADFASYNSSYAGWFYGVPLLATTVILVAATLLALWRVSSTPALPQRELAEVDAGWRRATNRIIVTISIAALFLQFGGIAIQSGLAIRNAYLEGVPAFWDTIGQIFGGGGLVMMVGSIAGLTLAALWAISLPDLALKLRKPTTTQSGEPASESAPR